MKKPRTIITTDMECDDMNSLIHLCLYLNEIELQGIIYTASRYHFNGDGIHTLGEVTPHYSTRGLSILEPDSPHGADPKAVSLKEYRPFPEHWIEDLWMNEYAEAYPYLSQNAEGYPSPEQLMRITKKGNTAFEGDVRFDTEGSDLIREKLLDDDERPLYLQSWGGMNTIVRALMSIAEDYRHTEQWPAIRKKVTDKAVVFGVINGMGQDHSWLDHGKELFPDLKLMRSEFIYGMYFAPLREQEDCIAMFKGDWMKKHIKFGHGSLMEKYGLMGDGTVYEGEPDKYQYGLDPVIDWGMPGFERTVFETYDFLGEGDSNCYIPLLDTGLRGLECGRYGTVIGRLYPDGQNRKPSSRKRFFKAYQQEFAARADWCCKTAGDCVHPPVVKAAQSDIAASPRETISLCASASSRDDLMLRFSWEYYEEASVYSGKQIPVITGNHQETAEFTVPEDACAGDEFVFVLSVSADCENPITRYAEIVVRI